MTENKRFTMCYEQNDINGWTMSIVDWETKEPFNYTTYEVHSSSITDTKDEMEDLCLLLNELNDEVKSQSLVIKEYQNRNEALFEKIARNALIQKADVVFDDIGGRNGRNFRLTLQLKTTYGEVNVSFNPMRLPQLLEQLGLERFSELEGTYVQIPKTNFGETVKGIKSIMAKRDEEWFKTENDIYFGSEFFKGYGD